MMATRALLRYAYLGLRGVALAPIAAVRWRSSLPQRCRKILLVRTDRIGDLVLSTPFLRNVREFFPDAEVTLLGNAFTRELLHGWELVDRILVIDQEAGAGVVRGLASEGYDLAVDMHYDYAFKTALLARQARARCSTGFDIGGRGALFDIPVPAHERKHFIQETFDILRALGLQPRPCPLEVELSPQSRAIADDLLSREGVGERYAVFHPGGSYASQRWPAANFSRLADFTAQLGLTPVLIGGEGDRLLLDEIAGTMTVRPALLCGQGVGVSAAAIARSGLFIGNNSGPLHIACAFSIPSVSTMGPTDPVRFWPRSDHARVVRARTVNEISVDEMAAAVTEVLPLGPGSATAGRWRRSATTGQEEGGAEDHPGGSCGRSRDGTD
jgi:ADP-heptose:LPS heptosyltransferase